MEVVRRYAPWNAWAKALQIAAAEALSARAHLIFVVIAGINCIFLSLFTPPFQVHDEFQHYLRAYQLSEGHIQGVTRNGLRGDLLPESLSGFILHTWGTLGLADSAPAEGHALRHTLQEMNRPLEPARRIFTNFSGAASYWPVPYVPQALAMAVARHFQSSPLTILFAGRLANAAAAIAVIAWSLRAMPLAREATLVVALLPMSQFQYASVSPDALTIASAFAFSAIALQAMLDRSWLPSRIALLTALGLVFCPLKPVYAPILFVGVLPLWTSIRGLLSGKKFRYTGGGLIVPLVVLAVSLLWMSSGFGPRVHHAAHFPEQIALLEDHPIQFGILLARTSFYFAGFYLQDAIGIFGSFTLRLPTYVYVLAAACFAISCLFPKDGFRALDNASITWNLMLAGATYLAIELALFIVYTKPGDWFIGGVQGRYFLPLGPLIAASFVSIGKRSLPNEKLPYVNLLILPGIVVVTLAMDVTVITGFGILSSA